MQIKEIKKLILLLIIPLLLGCERQEVKPFVFNGKEFNKIITAFLAGDSSAAHMVGFLFNNADPHLIEVNEFSIDSIIISDKTIYSLLVESNNPVFNVFSLVDNRMNVLLKDNSLNGYLSGRFSMMNNGWFYIINESFRSRDTFGLERTSIFKISERSVSLIFRAVTGYSHSNSKISSQITKFTDEKILLSLDNLNLPAFKDVSDEYLIDEITQRYSSEKNYLRNFALKEISNFKTTSKIDEITDHVSFRRVFSGSTSDPIFTGMVKTEFEINLTNEWYEFDNFSIKQPLKSEFNGTKYVNEKLGASISLIKLPIRDSAEVYTDIRLSEQAVYEHPVRYSDLNETGKHYFQMIEYTCKDRKFLMILEAPKFTYERNKDLYNSIIKSFKINC